MTYQKPFLKSKTVRSALLTFLISLLTILLEVNEQGINPELLIALTSLLITTGSTLWSRYVAKGELYTSKGLPGRDYIPASVQQGN